MTDTVNTYSKNLPELPLARMAREARLARPADFQAVQTIRKRNPVTLFGISKFKTRSTLVKKEFNTLMAMADSLCADAATNVGVVSPLFVVRMPQGNVWALWLGSNNANGFRFQPISLADASPFAEAETLAHVAYGEIKAMLAKHFRILETPRTQLEAARRCLHHWPCTETQDLLEDCLADAKLH